MLLLKKLDFKDRLHFNEFPLLTTKEWKSVIKENNYNSISIN